MAEETCTCEDSQHCACGNSDDFHCAWCCKPIVGECKSRPCWLEGVSCGEPLSDDHRFDHLYTPHFLAVSGPNQNPERT